MDGKGLVPLGAMEEPSEDVEPPEQPVAERDPSGRWSRVSVVHCTAEFLPCFC